VLTALKEIEDNDMSFEEEIDNIIEEETEYQKLLDRQIHLLINK
jgi:hypothetical protein